MQPIFQRLCLLLSVVASISMGSCIKNDPNRPSTPSGAPSDKLITYFGFKVTNNPGLAGDIEGIIEQDTIKLALPNSVPITNLKPTIIFTGKSINPENNIGQNFNNSVTYTVTAEDNTTKNYFVVIRRVADSSKNITSFTFKTTNNPGLYADVSGSITTDSIYAVVPFGTNLANLLPVVITTGVKISPASLSAQDFSQTIQYTVTAQDGTTKNYKVVVTAEEKQIPATIFINSLSQDGNVVGPSAGKVYAIDANTGNLQWHYAPPAGMFLSSPAFSEGVLYTANWNKIIALDTITKSIRWQYTAGNYVTSALSIVNGIVYANCNDGYLHAVDEATGNLKWKFAQQMTDTIHGNTSSPTVVNEVVYFGSRDEYVYAVDAVTGNLKWKTFNTYGFGAGRFFSSPVVVNGTLYIGDGRGNLLALNINDGSIKWVFEAGDLFISSPTFADDVIYIGSTDGYLYAVNAADGTEKWKHYVSSQVHASPIVSQGKVFVGGSGGSNTEAFYALDASNGSLKWMYTFDTDLLSSPIAFNRMVYFTSYEGLYALDITTGILKWKFNTINWRENMWASPCIVDQQGHIYYSTISGHQD